MADARPLLAASLAGLDGDPGESLRRVSAMGFRAVQLPVTAPGLRPRDLDGAIRRALRATLRRMELDLAGLDLWIPPGHFLDPAFADRAAGAVLGAIELAADLAAAREVDRVAASAGGSGPWSASARDTRGAISLVLPAVAPDRPEFLELVQSLLAAADRHGIDLIDHGHPVADAALVHRESHGVRWCVGIDAPAWIAAGTADLAGPVMAHADRLASVRLCDFSRSGMRAPVADRACGAAAHDARLDVGTLAATLSVAAPGLVPVADPRQWPDPWAGLAQTLAVWRRVAGAG